MRPHQTAPHPLVRQLAEWRLPMEADPAVDDAVTRMLRSIDRHLQRQQEPHEEKAV
jgi:hypothetical protein